MSWLDDHFENFVHPNLPVGTYGSFKPLGYFQPEELTVIKNQWRSVKRSAQGKKILLAGRDVFIFEVLAQREGYPTLFMPECSRMTVREIAKTLDTTELFLFDTGFAGSIPRGLGISDYKLMSYSRNSMPTGSWLMGQRYKQNPATKQVFPRLTFSRGLALKIEGTPKYWESGRLGGNPPRSMWTFGMTAEDKALTMMNEKATEIIQPMSNHDEFYRAACLTIEIYKNSAPKFIHKHQPVGSEARWKW